MRINKHPYQIPDVIDHFREFQTLGGYEGKAAEFLLRHFAQSAKGAHILYAGSGDGSRFLVPLIEAFFSSEGSCPSLNVVCLDNSKLMVKELRNNLAAIEGKELQRSKYRISRNGKAVHVEVLEADVDGRTIPGSLKDSGGFDILLCPFLLHHLVNWRLALARLLYLLKPGGSIFLAQRLNDLLYMDGNFSGFEPDKGTQLQQDILHFMARRNGIWNHSPEISGTTIGPVVDALTSCGSQKIDEEVFEWTARNDLLSRIKERSLTAFWLGLYAKDVEGILNDIQFPSGAQVYEDGLKLFLVKVPDPESTSSLLLFQFPKTIPSKLHHPIVYDKTSKTTEVISREISHMLSLLATHDAFTIMTKFAIGVYWSPIKRSWVDELQTMFFDNAELTNKHLDKRIFRLLEYFLAIQQKLAVDGERVQVTDLIFRDFKQKPIVIIRNHARINDSSKVQLKCDWNTSLDPRGMPSCLRIFIDLPTSRGEKQYTRESRDIDWSLHEVRPLRSNWRIIDFEKIRRNPQVEVDVPSPAPFPYEITLPQEIIAGELDQIRKTIRIFNQLLPYIKVLMEGYLTHLVFAPSQYFGEPNNEPSIGYGGVIFGENLDGLLDYLTNKEELDDEQIERTTKLVEEHLLRRASFCSLVARRILGQTGIVEYKQHTLEQATRSAVAAIMGRVNAHDFGHVLTNAKFPRPKNKDSDDSDNDYDINEKYFEHLTRFARELMVFASEASINDPTWAMPLPFMAQVVNQFSRFIVDETDNKGEVSPVCRHIAESEEVKKVNVNVAFNGNTLVYEWSENSGGNIGMWLSQQLGESGDRKPFDLYINMPTGSVGSHAFYCILENIIRNTAKYGTRPAGSNDTLELNVRIQSDDARGLYQVQVWDNFSKFTSDRLDMICKYFRPQHRPSVEEICTTKGEAESNESDDKLYEIIDHEGRLVSGGWGFKEMRICAAWLRKLPIAQSLIAEGDLPTPLLKPIIHQENGDEYIGYEFYLLKPKEALIIDSKIAENGVLKRTLQEQGTEVYERSDTVPWGTIEHSVCIANDAEFSQSEDFDRSNSRCKMPSVLILGPEVREPIDAAVKLNYVEYAELTQSLSDASSEFIRITKPRLEWGRKVLSIPLDLSLVLQLSDSCVSEYWKEAAAEILSTAQGNIKIVIDGAVDHKPTPTESLAVYDFHKKWKTNNGIRNGREYDFGRPATFYEEVRRNSPTQIILFNPPRELGLRVRMLCELIEAAFVQVAVVDERISRKVEQLKLNKILRQGQVFIPSVTEGFYKNPTKEHKTPLQEDLKKGAIRILLIHQGMLDRMFQGRREIEEWVEELKTTIPIIVVQSDRGENLLPRLPRNTRFAPFSATERWIASDDNSLSKYFLIQTLLSARKGNT